MNLANKYYFLRKDIKFVDYIPNVRVLGILLFVLSVLFFSTYIKLKDSKHLNFSENTNGQTMYKEFVCISKKSRKYSNTMKIYLLEDKIFGELRISKKINLKSGNIYKSKITIKKFEESFNPGGFNERIYSLSKFKYFKAKLEDEKIKKTKIYNIPIYIKYLIYIEKLKQNLINTFNKYVNSDIVNAIVLGDRENLKDEKIEAFKEINVYHILSISGMHISYILIFLKYAKVDKNRIIFLLFILTNFIFIVGISPSILRAVFTLVIYEVFKKNKHNVRFIDVISFSFVLNILINPYTIFFAGIYLSFLSVVGVKLYSVFYDYKASDIFLKNIYYFILNIALLSLTIQVLIWPILAYFTNYISFNFILGNMIIPFLSSLIIFVGFFYLILISIGFISRGIFINYISEIMGLKSIVLYVYNFFYIDCVLNFIYTFLGKTLFILSQIIEKGISIVRKIPLNYTYIPKLSITFIFIYYLTVFFLIKSIYLFKRKKEYILLNVLEI